MIADPVYYYRIREGGDALDHPAPARAAGAARPADGGRGGQRLPRRSTGRAGRKRWYDESVVADDLRYYLNVLDSADDEYRALFLDRVNAFLDGVERRASPTRCRRSSGSSGTSSAAA